MADSIEPVTHLEKVVAGQESPVTHLEHVIALYGGSGGSGTTNYIYEEEITTPSNSWNIQHNLNTEWYKLFINIIDSDNNIVFGDIDVANSTNNLLVIKFNTPIAGKIIIKK